ncbi:MAG: FAD-dependent oxidoreductase [Planctomycetaceae bacterium]|nr:FAD-dependent oxidoreductase [Planctomycetaceae bacterium]
MKSQRIVVVGGGVIGAFTAWYLQQSGHQVTIVEAKKFGSGCSHANCGYVCPSHVLPLTAPGVIAKTMRAMLRPNSPFSIRPRWSWHLWRWLANFALRCNHRSMVEAAPTIHQLLQSSLALYEQIIAEQKLQVQWERRGLLFVYQNHHHFEAYHEVDKLVTSEFGVPAIAYEGEQVRELEPALKPGLAGGWHYPGDCHLRPDLLMRQLRALLERSGVSIIEHAEVSDMRREGSRAVAVCTSVGEFAADQFAFATGAWTPLLSKALGVRVPIEPGKGYSITTTLPRVVPKIPLILEEHSVAITPFHDGYRIGSTMEFAGYDSRMNPQRLELLRNGARVYLEEPYTDQVQEEWYGWRPMTWDGKPVVDRTPQLSNVWIAAGHNMLGLSMAPATGKLMAELINDEVPHINPHVLSLRRLGIL